MATGFTTDDLDNVECAIRELIDGKQVVQVDLGGRVEVYTPRKLDELTKFRDIITAELNEAATVTRRPRVYRSRFSKGL